MNKLLPAVLCSAVSLAYGDAATPLLDFKFEDAGLHAVLQTYETWAKVKVEVVEGVYSPGMTLSTNKVTHAQGLELIENKLREMNIGLYSFASNRVVATWIFPSTRIAREYLADCKKNKTTVSLGKFGWNEVRAYWAKVPALQALRDQFEQDDEALREVLMQDEEYAGAIAAWKSAAGDDRVAAAKELNAAKLRVYRRLDAESEAYREARKRRDESLYQSNIQTFEYIIEDYERQEKDFPADWIGSRPPARRFGLGFRRTPVKKPAPSYEHLTPEEQEAEREKVRQNLRAYQMEVIRAGMAPLPIPITPDMTEELIEEGVLPPSEKKGDEKQQDQ